MVRNNDQVSIYEKDYCAEGIGIYMKKAEYLTPVVTIFDRVGNIDQKGNEMVYDFLIKGGVDGIVVMGSTGEFFAMSMEQKKRLIDIAVPYIKGKVNV